MCKKLSSVLAKYFFCLQQMISERISKKTFLGKFKILTFPWHCFKEPNIKLFHATVNFERMHCNRV